MNNKVIVPVLIAVIVIGGIAYASVMRKSPVINSPTVETIATTPLPSVSSSINANQSPSIATAINPSKDCGTDMNCFIAQASTCGPASVEFTATILKGLTGTSHIVISKSATADSCIFNQRTDKVVVQGKEDTSTVGTTIACSAVPSSKIVATLTNWNEDTFSSEDFVNGSNCKTTLPKALTDAMAQQDNTPPIDPQSDANTAHETFTGLGESSSIGRNGYQFYVSAVTSTTTTLELRGPTPVNSSTPPPAATVTLTLNVPQSYFGHTFTLTASTKNEYGDYIGTITVDLVQ